jgi:hypothetical protein
VVATFRLSLAEEVDKAFGDVLERAQKKKERPSSREKFRDPAGKDQGASP